MTTNKAGPPDFRESAPSRESALAQVSEFCVHTERRLRCVASRGHAGRHDLQPLGSASVRAIVRQEEDDLKLVGHRDGALTGQRILSALDEAVVAPTQTGDGSEIKA